MPRSTPTELIDHVKARLARYKAPKTVLVVASIGRAVNGKLDYKQVKASVLARVDSIDRGVTGTIRRMPTTLDWLGYDAVLFDLDGVITPTADDPRASLGRAVRAAGDFTSDDYLTYVDGKPRYDGVRSFLASRGVELPWGDPSDPPGDDTICAMGNRKNDIFNAVLDRDGIAPYPGTLAVLELLDRHHVPQAIVSSSKNARTVLAAAGLAARFAVVVDGVTAADRGPRRQARSRHVPARRRAARRRPPIVRSSSKMPARASRPAPPADSRSSSASTAGGNAAALEAAGADLVVADLGDTLAWGSSPTRSCRYAMSRAPKPPGTATARERR